MININMKRATLVIVLSFFLINLVFAQTEVVTDETLIRTPIEQATFEQLFPGAEVFFVYGGIGLGIPTAQVSRLEAEVSFGKHVHTHDYHAVIIAGNYQHWEEGDADQGPILTAGSTYFQAGGVNHYDACLGPETCVVYVYFPESADFSFVE